MPLAYKRGYRRGNSNRGLALRPVDSNKNIVYFQGSHTTSGNTQVIAVAKDSALNSVQNEVERGCSIRAIHYSIDVCGTFTSGTNMQSVVYIMKNPGTNITNPSPGFEGTSNEKKFIIKTFQGMTMRNQDGNIPLHWEGWLKIPRRYGRMGADDRWDVTIATTTTSATGHFTYQFIYKWYK